MTLHLSSSNYTTTFKIANSPKHELANRSNPIVFLPVDHSLSRLLTAAIPQQVTYFKQKVRRIMETPVWENADVLHGLAEFVGKDFLFFGGVSRTWRSTWGNRPAETRVMTAHTSVKQLLYGLECGLQLGTKLCAAAAGFGRRVFRRQRNDSCCGECFLVAPVYAR